MNKKRRFVAVLALVPLAVLAQSGQQRMTTVTVPQSSFFVNFNCTTLTASVVAQPPPSSPPSVTNLTPRLRRFTTTDGCSSGRNQWCTREVWRVTADYTLTSDLDPRNVSAQKDVPAGEIKCDCTCVNLTAPTPTPTPPRRACVSGKSISSSGLQGYPTNPHTNYQVEYTAKLDRHEVRWTQSKRVDGDRSWYGYSYSKCFDEKEGAPGLCQQMTAEGLSPPGCANNS